MLERIPPERACRAAVRTGPRGGRAADERVAAGESDLPPLLGVPATIKELIAVDGMPHTGGFPHRRKFRETADAPAVARLRDAGAVVLGFGNTPGPYFWVETNNRIYGRTSNAYDRRRTSGGSSGGDGAMVGSGGAPVALGSDMGGSVRIPAFFNGIFGHLPSPGLVPITGHFPMPSGDIRRTLFLGPLARRARICAGAADHRRPGRRWTRTPCRCRSAIRQRCRWRACRLRRRPIRRRCRCVRYCARLSTAPRRCSETPARRSSEVSLRSMRWALAQFGAVAWSEFDLFASWSA